MKINLIHCNEYTNEINEYEITVVKIITQQNEKKEANKTYLINDVCAYINITNKETNTKVIDNCFVMLFSYMQCRCSSIHTLYKVYTGVSELYEADDVTQDFIITKIKNAASEILNHFDYKNRIDDINNKMKSHIEYLNTIFAENDGSNLDE